MTLRIANFIDKGGTGKTTCTAHLGVALNRLGHQVLLVDLAGKQGDLGKLFGVWDTVQAAIARDDAWPNIATVFDASWPSIATKLGDEALETLIHETPEGVDIIPAHPGLDTLDSELATIDDTQRRYARLDTFLTDYIDPLSYDVVLIDLPGLSNNVSYNGLWAAQHVLAPVEMGPFEAQQASALQRDLEKFKTTFDRRVELTMLLPSKVDTRTTLADTYLESFQDEYPGVIAPEFIPYSQDIRNASQKAMTVFELADPSSTALAAREAFLSNAKTLINRVSA